MATNKKTSVLRSRDNICKFCEKGFSSERTLAKHMCVKKRRFADKDQPSCQLGFRIFQRFFELTTNSKEPKSVMDFINSSHYMAFVKFARYLIDLEPLIPDQFITYVIKNGLKVKDWSKMSIYEDFLAEHLRKETVQKALERSVVTIAEWGEENNLDYTSFYENMAPAEATHLIKSGRISPWLLYVSDRSPTLMGRLSSEQNKLIQKAIDVNMWNFVFHKRMDDVKFAREIIEEAGL